MFCIYLYGFRLVSLIDMLRENPLDINLVV